MIKRKELFKSIGVVKKERKIIIHTSFLSQNFSLRDTIIGKLINKIYMLCFWTKYFDQNVPRIICIEFGIKYFYQYYVKNDNVDNKIYLKFYI